MSFEAACKFLLIVVFVRTKDGNVEWLQAMCGMRGQAIGNNLL